MPQYPSGISIVSPKVRDASVVRRFVSQNGRGYISVAIMEGQTLKDPDTNSIRLRVWFKDPTIDFPASDDSRGEIILDLDHTDITRADTGQFYYDLGPENTNQRGVMTAEWTYSINGKAFQYTDFLQILEQMPIYERLKESEKATVERVSWMFGDLYDSTEGGPHLIEEFQTHYGYERIAQLAHIAVDRINTIGFSKPTTWGIEEGDTPLPKEFSGILVMGTYLEVIRHLIRSYTEIPNRPNMNVTYVDRTQYQQRWKTIYDMEYPEWKSMVKKAKLAYLGLGKSSILVGGGAYGTSSGMFKSGMYASAARAGRFYPYANTMVSRY